MGLISTLAADTVGKGQAKTREEWSLLLGQAHFEAILRRGLFVGPSGRDTIACRSCTRPGHSCPITPSARHPGSYEAFCEQAGIMLIPSAQIEGYSVCAEMFFRMVAAALQIASPDEEYSRLAHQLHFLGTGRLGQRQFSVIAAMNQKTESERQELSRRNREGFAGTRGVILACDPVAPVETRSGFHALRGFDDVIELQADGFKPRISELQSILGISGRPASSKTLATEAEEVFAEIFEQLGRVAKGREAFRLFGIARPDLTVSKSTLYAAKSEAAAKFRKDSNL